VHSSPASGRCRVLVFHPGGPAPAGCDRADRGFSAAGKSEGVVRVAKIVKSEAEWRSQLSPLAYRVAREQAPSWLTAAPMTAITRTASIAACAAIPRCSIRQRSLSPAPDGRASGSRFHASMCSAVRTAASECSAMRFPAAAATRIWATCSTTAQADRTALLHEFGVFAFRRRS